MKSFQTSSVKMAEVELGEKTPIVKIAFLDVGQADTIVVSCSDTHEAVIVDCVDADAVLDYLKSEQVRYLRGIIISHLHADHYGEVAVLLDKYDLVPGLQECEVVVFNEILDKRNLDKLIVDVDKHGGGTKRSLQTFLRNLREWCKRSEAEHGIPRCANLKVERRSLPINGALAQCFQLVHPHLSDFLELESQGLNNTSGVLRIVGSGSSTLLTGDLEPKGWQRLRTNHPDLQCDVLKFPHHGAWKDEDVDSLLQSLRPSIVVISVGTEGKKYGHPNPHVFDALYKQPHIRILCTEATDQCRASVLNERNSVVDRFKAHASKTNHQLVLSKQTQSCPCAGTVIIELDDEVRVLQPEIKFHRESIIMDHFKAHRCNIEYPPQTHLTEAVPQNIDL